MHFLLLVCGVDAGLDVKAIASGGRLRADGGFVDQAVGLRTVAVEFGEGTFLFLFITGNLKLIEQQLHQGFLAGHAGAAGGDLGFVAQALEIGRGDLAAVEQQGGLLVIEEVVGKAAHDLVEGELEAGSVLDDGEGEFRTLAGGFVVEAAEAASAAGRLAAGVAVELDVLAGGRLVGIGELRVWWLFRVHGDPYSLHNRINDLGPRSRGRRKA